MTVYKRTPTSAWVYDYWHHGVRHTGATGAATKREAKAYETRHREAARGETSSGGTLRITLGAALALYVEQHDMGASTRASYASRARCLALTVDVALAAHEVTTAVILRAAGAWTQAGAGGNTQRAYLKLMRAALAYARRRGYRVARDVEWPAPRTERKTRHLSEAEQAALVLALRPAARWRPGVLPHVWRAWVDQSDLVVALLDTGCRHGEVVALPWSAVKLGEKLIVVQRWKTQRTDTVAMTRRVAAVLARRRLEDPEGLWVFAGAQWGAGGHRGYSTRGIHAVMDACGFNPPSRVAVEGRATVHSLRHTFASRLVARHGLAFVRDRLGHSNVQQTERYAHLDRARGALEAAATLDAMESIHEQA